MYIFFFFLFKQKTAYEMRISDWSSDVCSSDLPIPAPSSDRTWQPVPRSVVPCQHGAALVQRAWHGPHTPADRTKPADSAATRARGCACGPADRKSVG